ncbi:outer membrane protein assembly factor BamA [Nitrosophilus alvini]|uniref:outer membrane protein assembly factor BamA n=1 Tax=Nitrosophilus alvini TaxID=2714855 RepID=UPI00190BC989|nr:outer membrane protein assembly factor BamA [Nitrosophilus alvini]
MNKKLIMIFLLVISINAKMIKEIKFEGLIHLSPSIAKEIAGISEGSEIDIEKIDLSIKKFFEQGYFKDIWVTEENGVLTYHFIEKPLISKIEIKGYLENKKEELPDILGIKKGDIFDEEKIELAKRKIIDKARSEGYYDTVVEVETKELAGGSIEVYFLVNKGENIIIRELKLCGIKSFDKDDIEEVIANRERDFLGWMWGFNDGKVKMDQLEYDGARIKDLYMRKGFLDAKVSNPFLRVDFNTYNAKLAYHIFEGEPYIVRKIDIFLTEPVVKTEDLKKDLKLKVGKIFNIEKLRQDMQKIKEKVANKGYAYVQVIPDFKKDEKKHETEVIFTVVPGKKVYIRDVIISGNQRTLDRVIRREIYLAPGDLYNLTDLKDSKNALKRTGFFEDVIIEEKRVSEDKIDLLVKVKEMPTGNIMVGGGYGSYEGVILNASISDRNIFGSGIDVSLGIDYSSKSTRFNTSLYNPRVFDSDYSLGISLYNSRYQSYDYTSNKKGGSITVGKQFARYLRGSVMYQYSQTELSDVTFDSIYFPEGQYTKSSLTPSLNFDNTDDYYVPRSGIVAGTSLEYAGIGGDEKFVKSYTRFAYYFGFLDIIDYDLIFRYKARLGYIYDNGYLPVNEKFYIGGIRSVRGYSSGSLSPKDSEGRLIGGKKTFSNSLEASIPLIESAKMRLAFFIDYGMIGDESFTDIQRAGAGAAIEWLSPMGPIQLIFATPLNDKPGDRTSSFEFSMGTKF